MKKRSTLLFVLLFVLFLIEVAGSGEPAFRPVQVRTQVLTMTGMRSEAPAAEPRDYSFGPVRVRTQTLTMTGVRE